MATATQELNEYQRKLAETYRNTMSAVVVIAPVRHGTTTGLIDIVIRQQPAELVVSGRHERHRAVKLCRTIAYKVRMHNSDRTDNIACTIVDCINHRDLVLYLKGVQCLIVMKPWYTAEEARMAPAFFGRVRQLTKVTANTKRMPTPPREATNFQAIANVFVDISDTPEYACSFVVSSSSTRLFGSPLLGDAPVELMEWVSALGDDLIDISTSYYFTPIDTVYIIEPERIAAVEEFSRACAVEYARQQQASLDEMLSRMRRTRAPTQ